MEFPEGPMQNRGAIPFGMVIQHTESVPYAGSGMVWDGESMPRICSGSHLS